MSIGGRVAQAVVAAFLVGTVPSHGSAQVAPPIEYAYPDQSIWTTRLTPQGELENPLLVFAARLFTRVGIEWRAKAYPAARMAEALRDGTATFSMLVDSPALRNCCLWSRMPVAQTEMRIFRLADRPPVDGREGLIGKDVITIRGYTYGGLKGFLDDPANRVSDNVAGTREAAFAMLRNGRADYLIDYAGPAAEILAAHPIDNLVIQTLQRLEIRLVLAKSYPDAERVMARLESAAENLRQSAAPQ